MSFHQSALSFQLKPRQREPLFVRERVADEGAMDSNEVHRTSEIGEAG